MTIDPHAGSPRHWPDFQELSQDQEQEAPSLPAEDEAVRELHGDLDALERASHTRLEDLAEERRKRRRRRIIAVVVTFMLVLAAAGVAAMLSRAGISGSVKSGKFLALWDSQTTAQVSGSMPCTASTTAVPGTLVFDSGTTLPGDTCNVTAQIAINSPVAGMVTGLTLPGLPAGWHAQLDPASCGKLVPASNGFNSVPVTFTMVNDADGNGTSSAIGQGAGVEVTAANQVSGTPTCPAVQGQ